MTEKLPFPAGPNAASIPLILASGSTARAAMLKAVGLDVHLHPANVDEESFRHALRADRVTTEAAAEALAELKAVKVAGRYPQGIVIAADQMLDCGGIWFEKPVDRDHAFASLQTLAGRTHRLVSSVVLYRNGARIWHHTDVAEITMRRLDDGYIERYLDHIGDEVFSTVGCYRIEGIGMHLFSKVQGDYYTILGMPLLPLLDNLREQGVVA
ncbi:MAG: Maf family protein [Rhodospirillales bacterium]